VIDIHVARSGDSWWLPFILGAVAGAAGTYAGYRLIHKDSKDSKDD
jgi:hypothetical protein